LNDGDYIQLNLYNYKTNRIGVQLEFNGVLENNMLILNPGEKVLIDRFIDTNKKIKFDTYFINKNDKQSKKSISENGKLKIYFWDESIYNYYNYYNGYNYNYYNYYNGYNYTQIPYNNVTYESSKTISTNTNSTNNILTSSNNVYILQKPEIEETGRISKGKKSNQEFSITEFESSTIFHTEKYKLIPFSKKKNQKLNKTQTLKNITVNSFLNKKNTDHRIYCNNPMCGYRIRNRNWKFCPICSNEIE